MGKLRVNQRKVPHSDATYNKIQRPGRYYNQRLLGVLQNYVSVADGDLIVYRVESSFLGDENKPEHVYEHYEIGRVLGRVLRDGAGKAYELPHFIVLQLDTMMTHVYERHVPTYSVVWSMRPNDAFVRWFFTGKIDFEEADKLLKICHYGALNSTYFKPREDGTLEPSWDCPCYQSIVLPGVYIPKASRAFELWLTARGVILDNGDSSWQLNRGMNITNMVTGFLTTYRHVTGECMIVANHARRLEDASFAKKE